MDLRYGEAKINIQPEVASMTHVVPGRESCSSNVSAYVFEYSRQIDSARLSLNKYKECAHTDLARGVR